MIQAVELVSRRYAGGGEKMEGEEELVDLFNICSEEEGEEEMASDHKTKPVT